MDISENGVKIIKESFFAHDCTCPLIRYLLEFWPGKKEKLLYKLLSNYKLKKTIGLYYFLFYNEYFKNCIYDFEDLSVQIIFTDVLSMACTLPGLIDNIYDYVEEGDFKLINFWNKENIWKYGGLFYTREIMEKYVGVPISGDAYIDYLKSKYKEIYQL